MSGIFTITERDEAPASDNPPSTGPDQLKMWRIKMTSFKSARAVSGSLMVLLVSIVAASASEAPTRSTSSLDYNITKNFSISGQSTTVYTQPNNTGGTTSQGSERGSSANQNFGVGFTYRFK
jgi:hypothetical protein